MTHYSSNTNGNLPGDPPDSINSNTDSTTPSPDSELADPDQHDLGQPDEDTNGETTNNDTVAGQNQEENQNEEDNKTVEDGMLVCQGAMCNCSLGTMPSQLVVTSHRKYYVNDPQGAQKMVATTLDNKLTNLNFGVCKNGSNPPPPCAANLQWTKEHSTISIESIKASALSENSEALCQLYPGKVTIMQNGQIPTVNAQNFKNVSVTAPAANCLVDAEKLEELKKEEEIRKIYVKAIKSGEVSSDTYKSVESLKVRPEEPLKFVAKLNHDNATQQEKLQIDWMVTRDGSPLYAFGNHGDVLEITFEETGSYRVEAHTGQRTMKDGKVVGSYESCSLDVLVVHNSIKKITSEDIRSKNRVRIGPVVFTAEFEMPPNQKELDSLVWELKDNENGCLETLEKNVVFPTTKITNKMEYFVSASLGEGKGLTLKLVGNKNTVKEIQGTVNGKLRQIIRPDELITFTVTEGQYGDNLTETEQQDVKWKHFFNNAPDAGEYATGGSIPAQTYPVGKHIMEAYVSSYNAIVKTTRYDRDDDWEFEVTENYINQIVGELNPKLGSENSYFANAIMPMNAGELAVLQWYYTKGPVQGVRLVNTNELKLKANSLGKCFLYAVVENNLKKKFKIELNIRECKVIKGGWSDEDGNRISTAGYKQEVYIYFEHVGLDGETVEISVYDDDKMKDDVVYTTTETIPAHRKEWHQVKILLDDKIREKIEDGLYGDYGKLYFKIKGKSVKTTNEDSTFPKDEGKYLHVTKKERIVRAYFADPGDRNRFIKADYSDSVSIQLHTTNLIDEKIKITLMELKAASKWWAVASIMMLDKNIRDYLKKDKELKTYDVTINKQGQANVDISISNFKKSHEGGPSSIRELYMVLKYKDKEYVSSFHLNVYQELSSAIKNKKGQTTVGVETVTGEGNCGGKYCLIVGNKGKLIEEINIRLAGFGGLVPTDIFTSDTRQAVIQFQKDYMGIEPTGRICGNTLKAIGEFGKKYKFPFDQLKCHCTTKGQQDSNVITGKKEINNCQGFGDGSNKGKYKYNDKKEKYHFYEYPGVHRSLLWGYKAFLFYLEKTKSKYTVNSISSAFRCRFHSIFKGSKTTNHLGKAMDILFDKNGVRTKKTSDVELIRKEYFVKYSGASIDWGVNNKFGLESTKTGAISWVHLDVRKFAQEYLLDKFFVKNESDLNGEELEDLANRIVYSCDGKGCPTCNSGNGLEVRVDPLTLSTSDKGIEFIKDWESFRADLYNDSEGHCTIGYGHLVHEGNCDGNAAESEFKNGISESKADELFTQDLIKFEKAVRKISKVNLYQYEFDALVSLLYNAGANFLPTGAPKLYKYLNNGDYDKAASEFLDITNNNTSGLVKRRKAENQMFLNNIYDSNH